MRKYLISLLGLLIFLGCSINRNYVVDKDAFIKFTNSNKTTIKRDGEVFKDKVFTLQIPNSLKSQTTSVSYYFLQDLKFSNDQRIIILYVPDKKYVFNKGKTVYSNNDFINELEKLDILQELKDIKFIKNRYFNIALLEDNFFVISLNIKEKNINDFDYCIKSVNLKS